MSNNNIEQISKEFKETMDLKIQLNAQMNIITSMTKKNKEQQEEINHLKKLLESTAPLIKAPNELNKLPGFLSDSEEQICRMEIEKLRDKASVEQLTYEDAKKLEVYTKILNTIRNSPKIIEVKTKKLTESELMAAIESSDVTE
jgi:hypothetical protein